MRGSGLWRRAHSAGLGSPRFDSLSLCSHNDAFVRPQLAVAVPSIDTCNVLPAGMSR